MRSVVIRMNIDEMPTGCGPCELSCTAICKEWTKVDRKEIGRTKSPNCPIIAILPECHGRLVDADAFISTIRPLCEEDKFAACKLETVKRLMVEHINNAPTIVPAEAERSETCLD